MEGLRPSVAFAERMQRVHFAEIVRGAGAEGRRGKALEMFLARQRCENRRGGDGDVGVMRECVAALGDVDGAKLPGPFVDVAEQAAVDGFQQREIEASRERVLRERVR